MNALLLINSYIKYVYYLLGIILLICLIVLIKTVKAFAKKLDELNTSTNNVKQGIIDINAKVETIEYTLEHSIPLFAFMFFTLIIIVAAIKDYNNTKLTKKNFVKSTIKEYKTISSRYKLKRTRGYSRRFISEIIKLA